MERSIIGLIKKFYIFIVLDLIELILWLVTLSPFHFLYEAGSIDSQSKMFFLCLLLFYFAVIVSISYFIYFVYANIKQIVSILIAFILNIHIFVLLTIFIIN